MTNCAACYEKLIFCRRCKTVHCGCGWNQCKAPVRGPVTHVYLSRPGPFGGMIHTTLCGRMALPTGKEQNETPVNCKLCLKKKQVTGESA